MDLVARIFISGFVFAFFILIAMAMMSYVLPNKKLKGNGVIGAFKTYWSEMLLVFGMMLAAYFFLKARGLL